jgi:hypothetical protein
MPGTFGGRAEPSAPRALMPSLAIAGIGAALAVAAAMPAAAIASPAHRTMAAHHVRSERQHNKHLVIRGLVAGHHGRTMTVFAKTTKVGTKTKHNERIKVTFARSAHGRTKIATGEHIRLVARGTESHHHFTIRHNDDETVTASPATLIFGTVNAVNANLLTISENDRDNGDRHDGGDNDGEHHGGGDNARPADHGPGGGDGDGDGDGDGHGHQVMVDDTTAAITVDGQAGTIAVGDTVAVLGEATDNTVVASTIYAFTAAPAFMRGEIRAISGDNVTLKDDGNSTMVSLTGVPLALNGDVGATTSQLVVGDKLLIVGTMDASTGQITPMLAFAFNHHDDNPCGDNDGGEHGGDGGGDGGIDG